MRNIKKYFINENNSIRQASNNMTKFGLRCLLVLNKNNIFLGTLSTGDIRKCLTRGLSLSESIKKIYQKKPIFLKENNFKKKNIKKIFINKNIDTIPVINKNRQVFQVITYKKIFANKKKKLQRKLLNCSVLIMAGGRGTRLAPFTHVLPKPLIPLNKKTLIEHILDQFKINGAKKVSLSVNYKSKTLISFLDEISQNYFKINFYKEDRPLGTIGILRKIYRSFGKNILVTNCDTIIKYNYKKILEHHEKKNNAITLVLAKKKQNLPYGVCEIKKSSSDLVSIKEKPNITYLANTGFYLIKNELAKYIPKNKNFDFNELIQICLLKKRRIGTFVINENNWLDVGQWKEYQLAQEKLKVSK